MNESGWSWLVLRGGKRLAVTDRLEYSFHFPIHGKAPGLRFGEDQGLVHEHIELAGFTGRDLGGFTEAPFQ